MTTACRPELTHVPPRPQCRGPVREATPVNATDASYRHRRRPLFRWPSPWPPVARPATTSPARPTPARDIKHRPAAAGEQDHPLRGVRQAADRGEDQGAVRRTCTVEYDNASRDANDPAAAGRHHDHQGRQGDHSRLGRLQGDPVLGAEGRTTRASRSSRTTASPRARSPPTSRSTTTRSASCRARRLLDALGAKAKPESKIVMINGDQTDPNAGPVQGRRPQACWTAR